jgi:hypothetical protein
MLHLEDPSNNGGRGWVRLSARQLVDLLYIGLKLAARRHRAVLADRNPQKSDEAAKAIACHLAERLGHYPVFGPERPAEGPTCGGGSSRAGEQPLGSQGQAR